MTAQELRDLVKRRGTVTVTVAAASMPSGEGNLSDHGASVAGISTYLQSGMKADIVDVCVMPPIKSNLLDAEDYHKAMIAGHVYFVFYHAPYVEHNERIASPNWTNDSPQAGELREGTAVQTGCYSGYDMVGFAPEEDVSFFKVC